MKRALAPIAWILLSLFYLACFPEVAAQSAISVQSHTTNWIGYDGTWSPFVVKVGTPPQWVYLFPSTSISETWVIGASGCDGTIQCQTARGGTFLANESSTWVSEGGFNLGLDPNLGFSGSGYYGLDAIQLNDSVSKNGQVIAIVNDTNTWTGLLGLGVQGTTFVEGNDNSLLASLGGGNNSILPSLSYGFTAGASYRLKEVPGSLTLGGYDAARIKPNDATFSLDSNQQPSLMLNSIVATGWTDQNVTLLDTADQGLFTIDSSTPFLWLPEPAALRFEQTFGLEYNDTLQLYFYPNGSQPNSSFVSALNDCTFEFTFSDVSGSSQTLDLSLVGQAFTSMSLSYGYPNLGINASSQPIPYWPVRKAANSTQYTIGRMFLQETYLTVDYERNNFSLSQAVFSQDALSNMQIVDILSINSTSQEKASPQGLSTGTIVGIAVGAVCLLIIVIGTIMILLIRKRRLAIAANGSKQRPGVWDILLGRGGDKKFSELPVTDHEPPVEIQSNEIKEMHGSHAVEVKELHGRGLDSKAPVSSAKSVVLGVDHDPSAPVELPLRTSADFGRDIELSPPTYTASSLALSNSSYPNQMSAPVSPLAPPSSTSEKTSGTWLNTDISSESGIGTNESLSPAHLHPLHPASRNASPRRPQYVLDETQRARISLRYSGSVATSSPEPTEPRRFSWESTG